MTRLWYENMHHRSICVYEVQHSNHASSEHGRNTAIFSIEAVACYTFHSPSNAYNVFYSSGRHNFKLVLYVHHTLIE